MVAEARLREAVAEELGFTGTGEVTMQRSETKFGGAFADDRALDLLAFFGDRLKVYLRDKGARHDLIDAVFGLEGQDDLLMIVRRVREEVGPGYPISVKLNSADFQKGGFDDDESRRVVGWLEQAGVDLLEISGGNYEQPQFIIAGRGRGGADAMLETVRESTRLREAYFLDYAVAMRDATRMPLMVTGGFRSVEAMRRALDSGALDVIGLGRPLITAPDGCAGLLDGSLPELPAFERSLRVEVPADELAVQPSLLAAVKGWGIQGWFCVQLLRMGDGQDPDPALPVYDAYRRYSANEDATLRGLLRKPA